MQKPGIFAWFSYPLPIEERFRLIREAGIEAVSLWWGDEDRHAQPDMAGKLGLEIDNFHAPFYGSNKLWQESEEGDALFAQICTCTEDCARHGIGTAVIHAAWDAPLVTEYGLRRFDRLVDLAEKLGVNLAFENCGTVDHLEAILSRYDSPRVGFCYDSGHEHCNHPDVHCLSRWGDRLMAVHLDDNCGDGDSHLLPFDGTCDWDAVRAGLRQARPIPYLTLEVDFNPQHEASRIYKPLSAEAFLARAADAAKRLQK